MPKIAIFMNSLSGGGMERAVLNLANFFINEGAEVDLLVASIDGPLLAEIPDSVTLVNLKMYKSKRRSVRLWMFKAAFKMEPLLMVLSFAGKLPKAVKVIPGLVDYMCEKQPDTILSTPTTANLAVIWAKSFSGYDGEIIIREASTLTKEIQNKNSVFFRLSKRFVRKWYNFADFVICVSDGVKQDLNENFLVSSKKLKTIYNILDIKKINNLSKSRDNDLLMDKYGDFVLAIGRLEVQKDFDTLIRAFHDLSNDVSVNLVILGEGSERLNLERLIQNLSLEDRVYLPGFFINPYPFIAKCTVFALSSRWEGCPNVLREALVLQKNVISTDCPSGAKEILDNGKLGVLVPVGCVEQYSRELKKLIQENCNTQNTIAESMNQASIDLYREIFL